MAGLHQRGACEEEAGAFRSIRSGSHITGDRRPPAPRTYHGIGGWICGNAHGAHNPPSLVAKKTARRRSRRCRENVFPLKGKKYSGGVRPYKIVGMPYFSTYVLRRPEIHFPFPF